MKMQMQRKVVWKQQCAKYFWRINQIVLVSVTIPSDQCVAAAWTFVDSANRATREKCLCTPCNTSTARLRVNWIISHHTQLPLREFHYRGLPSARKQKFCRCCKDAATRLLIPFTKLLLRLSGRSELYRDVNRNNWQHPRNNCEYQLDQARFAKKQI
jgi:hypothetical protein